MEIRSSVGKVAGNSVSKVIPNSKDNKEQALEKYRTTDYTTISKYGKLKIEWMSLRQVRENISEGKLLIQTADNSLSSIQKMIQKVREVAIKAAQENTTPAQRLEYQISVSELVDEIDRLASTSDYNYLTLFQGDFHKDSRTASMWFTMGPNMHNKERILINTMTARALSLTKDYGLALPVNTREYAEKALNQINFAKEKVSTERAHMSAYIDRLDNATQQVNDQIKTIEEYYKSQPDAPVLLDSSKQIKNRGNGNSL